MKKASKITLLIILIVVASVGACFLTNYLQLDRIDSLKSIINNGISGSLIYVFILALQILFVPINSLILIIPAIILFGTTKAFFLSLIGLIIGSTMAYFMGRIFGKGLIGWLVGKENTERWQNKLGNNGKYILPFLLLIPVFPDEIICMISGVAKIKFPYFISVITITRTIDLACTCFIGAIIPFQGWWLLLWLAFMLIAVVFTLIMAKNQSKIENWINSQVRKIKRRT